MSVVQVPGPWKAKARDEYGTVMGYCCDEGHPSADLALKHGEELVETWLDD